MIVLSRVFAEINKKRKSVLLRMEFAYLLRLLLSLGFTPCSTIVEFHTHAFYEDLLQGLRRISDFSGLLRKVKPFERIVTSYIGDLLEHFCFCTDPVFKNCLPQRLM